MGELEDKLNSILSSPAEMEKILGLAKELSGSLGGGEEKKAPPPPQKESFDLLGGLGDMDPRFFKVLGRIMGESAGEHDKSALISAMKPYVRAERRETLDRALKIAKLARIARVALAEFGGGDSDLDL